MAVPLLSVCIIVKNEVDNLPRCLRSVANIADQIIVVDTGSTDGTAELAERLGAQVYHYVWTESFSAARNASIEHAEGKWILCLDADEALADNKDTLRDLLSDPELQGFEGFFLPMVNFVGERAHRRAVTNPSFRLFRNRPAYRFQRALHEQMTGSILETHPDAKLGTLTVSIEHIGYLNSFMVRQDKMQRNFTLAKKELKQHPFDGFAWFNLAQEYLRLNQSARALYCYRRAFLNNHDMTIIFIPVTLRNIASCLMDLRRDTEALELLDEAVDAYPDYTDLHFQRGVLYTQQEKWTEAAGALEKCLAMGEAPLKYMSDEGVGSYKARTLLGECQRKQGQLNQASQTFLAAAKDAVERHRYFDPPFHGLINLMRQAGTPAVECLRFLEQEFSLDSDMDLRKLTAKLFLTQDDAKVAEELADEAWQHGNPGDTEALMLLGTAHMMQRHYEEAIRLLNMIPKDAPEFVSTQMQRLLSLALSGNSNAAISIMDETLAPMTPASISKTFYETLIHLWCEQSDIEKTTTTRYQSADPVEQEWLESQTIEILGLLLRLEEFEQFEQTLPMLSAIGMSIGQQALQLGTLYYKRKYPDLAMEQLVIAAQHGCADAEAYQMLGLLCLQRKCYPEAETFFKETLTERPDSKTCYAALITALIAQDKKEAVDSMLLLTQ